MKPVVLLLAALALAGCGTDKAVRSSAGPCLALKPHFPERVAKEDTQPTKRSAYSRNVAFDAACPGQSSQRKR